MSESTCVEHEKRNCRPCLEADVLRRKVQRLRSGESVVVSDKECDVLETLNLPRLATLPNPGQVGTKDRWLAYLVKPKLRDCVLCGDLASATDLNERRECGHCAAKEDAEYLRDV